MEELRQRIVTSFHWLPVTHSATVGQLLEWMKDFVAQYDSSFRAIGDFGIATNGVVLVGGGGGTSTVSRALQSIGSTGYGMLAPTGKSVVRRRWMGPQVQESVNDFARWNDIVRMGLYGLPLMARGEFHSSLEGVWQSKMQTESIPLSVVGCFLFEALKARYGIQRACEILNILLGNSFFLAVTTENAADMRYVVNDRVLNFQQYIVRKDGTVPSCVFLAPPAYLSAKARSWISHANCFIFGPGDVTITTQFHFCVSGFREVLASNPQATIILVANLTSRHIDLSGFKLSNFLEYWSHLLCGRQVFVLVNTSVFPGWLVDDMSGCNYRNFHLVRADLIGEGFTDDEQPKHDSVKLGTVLKNLYSF